MRCDNNIDCLDRSDEKACQNLIYDDDYQTSGIPFNCSMCPLELHISLKINNILYINTVDQKFTASYELKIKW